MVDRDMYGARYICGEGESASGWQVYYEALEYIDQAEWSRALALLAEAETTFRTYEDYNGLWRALIGQALSHWRAGAATQAIARAMAALHAADMAGDCFATGCVAWQLATMLLRQGHYRRTADHLIQAQTALDKIGMAPPGGILATAAQLCIDMIRWHQACERGEIGRHEAMAAIAEMQYELIGRLEQAAVSMWATHRSRAHADETEIAFLILDRRQPPALPEPAKPQPALGARLARWWRRLHDADDTPASQEHTQVPVPALPSAEPAETYLIDKPILPEAPINPTSEDTPAQPEKTAANDSQPDATPARRQPATASHAGLAIYCFGNFRVYIDDILVEHWESARARTLFKYLVAQRATAAPKEMLADLFWPGSEAELARRSLHQAIYCLRQTFKRIVPDVQIIQFVDDRYQINPDITIWIDSEAFKEAIEQGRALMAVDQSAEAIRLYTVAIDLYSGEFLPEERYERWTEESRRTYQAMYLETLHQLARHHEQRGEHQSAILLCQQALTQESCDEEMHRLLMVCYMAQGLRHLAVRQYQICVNALKTELGIAPSDELEAFYRRVVTAGSDGTTPTPRRAS